MECSQSGTGAGDGTGRLEREIRELRRKVKELSAQVCESAQVCPLVCRKGSQPAVAGPKEHMQAIAQQVKRQAMLSERDNMIARQLQQSVRPLWLGDFKGVEVAFATQTGARVGGDFYDVIKISDSSLGLLIADVSGHGLCAAVIMATARMAFRTFATMESNPLAIMERVNEALLSEMLAGHHLTAFMGLLDSEMLTLQYVNASQCPPYVLRKGQLTPLDTEGLFVGMFEEPDYEQKSIQLERNDKLFLFTDGLIRHFQGEADEAVARLERFLCENAGLPVKELTDILSETITSEPKDDVAMLAVELRRRGARRKQLVIQSLPTEARRVEDTILPALSVKGYGERALFAVKLALEEAIINAIKHGNELDSTKKVTVDFSIEEDRAVISVADEGSGFDPQAVPDPTLSANLEVTSGRGLVLMRAYMDRVEFNEKGNKVTLTKFAPWRTGTNGSSES